MKIAKLRFGFTNISDKDLIPFAKGIIQQLEGNLNFKDAAELLTVVEAAFDKYYISIPARNARNSINTATKRENKIVLINKLKDLGRLVESIANGNIELLEETGFELQDKPQNKPMLGQPNNIFITKSSAPNSIIVQCQYDKNASLYEARVSTDEVNWSFFGANNSRKVELNGLPIGDDLYLQMRMKNTNGYGEWSGTVIFNIPKPNAVTAVID